MAKKKESKPAFDTVIIKLNNGETLITDRMKLTNGKIVLHRPMNIVFVPIMNGDTNETEHNVFLKNWLEGASLFDYTIDVDSVMVETEPDLRIKRMYNRCKIEDERISSEEEIDEAMREYFGDDSKSNKKDPSSGDEEDLLDDESDDDFENDGEDGLEDDPRY